MFLTYQAFFSLLCLLFCGQKQMMSCFFFCFFFTLILVCVLVIQWIPAVLGLTRLALPFTLSWLDSTKGGYYLTHQPHSGPSSNLPHTFSFLIILCSTFSLTCFCLFLCCSILLCVLFLNLYSSPHLIATFSTSSLLRCLMNALTKILGSYPARQHFWVWILKFGHSDDGKNTFSYWAA